MSIVSDSKVIINTQGIRWIKKIDHRDAFGDRQMRYSLKVQYKGSELNVEYDNSAERDELFNRLNEAVK